MSLPDALFGDQVAQELAQLPADLDVVPAAERLRKGLPPELARRATELWILRRRAQGRFRDAGELFFTPAGLEQATRPEVAEDRASVLRGVPGIGTVLDATCGVGSDARALAGTGFGILATDVEADAARCARANLAALGAGQGRWLVAIADARRPAALTDAVLLDPDRRAEGRRELNPARWSPTLAESLAVAEGFAAACLKLAPAFEPGTTRIAGPHRWSWVSLGGELLELALWLGSAAGDAAGAREAVLLDRAGGRTVLQDPSPPTGSHELAPPLPDGGASAEWIVDPDPAVIRAGLVSRLAADLGLSPVGPAIAFLGGEAPPRTPFGTAFRVIGTSTADPRRVRRMLAEHDVGPVDVLRRGHPSSAARLAQSFRGRGQGRGTVLVARTGAGHRAWLVERVSSPKKVGEFPPDPADHS